MRCDASNVGIGREKKRRWGIRTKWLEEEWFDGFLSARVVLISSAYVLLGVGRHEIQCMPIRSLS
jgi:hypothetical protein